MRQTFSLAPAGVGALLIIMVLAAVVRLVGIDALLPLAREADPYVLDQAQLLLTGEAALAAYPGAATKYPQLLARVLAALPSPAHSADPQTLDEHLARAASLHLRARIVLALIAILLVPLTFALARRFQPLAPSLLAATLVALCLLHNVSSRQARPHAPATSFLYLGLLAILHARRRDTPTAWLGAGAAVGAAAASLQTGLILLPAAALAGLLRVRREGRSRMIGPVLALGAIAGALWWAWPPVRSLSLTEMRQSFRVGGLQTGFSTWNGRGFLRLPVQLWEFDPVLAVLAGLGVVSGLRGVWLLRGEERRDVLVVLAFALPYLLAIGIYDQTQSRYQLPLLPLLALAAAAVVQRVTRFMLGGRSPGAAAQVVAWVVVLAFPVWANARLAWLTAGPSTLDATAEWIEQHVDRHTATVVLQPGRSLPLFSVRAGLARQWFLRSPYSSPWFGYELQQVPWPEQYPTWRLQSLVGEGQRAAVAPSTPAEVEAILSAWNSPLVVLWVDTQQRELPLVSSVRSVTSLVARLPASTGQWAYNERLPSEPRVITGIENRGALARVMDSQAWGPSIEIRQRSVARAMDR